MRFLNRLMLVENSLAAKAGDLVGYESPSCNSNKTIMFADLAIFKHSLNNYIIKVFITTTH
jgi:hypothetical protein